MKKYILITLILGLLAYSSILPTRKSPQATPKHDFAGALLLGGVPLFGHAWIIDVLTIRAQSPSVSFTKTILPGVLGASAGTTLWYQSAQLIQEKLPETGLKAYAAASVIPAAILAARIYFYNRSRQAFRAFINRTFKS